MERVVHLLRASKPYFISNFWATKGHFLIGESLKGFEVV
jgi:hypothetical protein